MIVATKLKPNDPEDKKRSVIMTGIVTTELKHSETRDGAPKLQFKIRYIKANAKREDKEMNILIVGDHDVMAVANTLEIGDVVMISGIWQAREYENRDGIKRVWNECRADFILPMKAVVKLLCPDRAERPMQKIDERRLMGADYETIEDTED